ncbi:MAG: hypothetical protein ACI3ZQ_08220 [Candidatus Cryptobacteroides sp.]
MIYYGLDGKERKSQITGLPLGKESYFINGSFATKGAADIALEKDPDAVLLSAYLKNGNKVRAIISADYGKFVTGIIDCSKPINTLVIKDEGEEFNYTISDLFTSDKPVKGPFIIDISEGTENPETGEEYFISCNGKLAHMEDIGKLVEEFFAGTPIHQATVHIKSQNSIPMGVITDIKVQLRNARALKIRYERDSDAEMQSLR